LSSNPRPWTKKFEKHVQAIWDASRDRGVRIAALFALARIAEWGGEVRQEEAVKLYQQFLTTFKDPPKNDRYYQLLTGVLLNCTF